MQLQQVEAIDSQVSQAVFDEARQVLRRVALGGVRRQTLAGLGRDHDLFLALAFHLPDQALAAAGAVNIGGIDEVHAQVHGTMQCGQRCLVIDGSPATADCPRPKTDLRNLPAGTSKFAIFHNSFPYKRDRVEPDLLFIFLSLERSRHQAAQEVTSQEDIDQQSR